MVRVSNSNNTAESITTGRGPPARTCPMISSWSWNFMKSSPPWPARYTSTLLPASDSSRLLRGTAGAWRPAIAGDDMLLRPADDGAFIVQSLMRLMQALHAAHGIAYTSQTMIVLHDAHHVTGLPRDCMQKCAAAELPRLADTDVTDHLTKITDQHSTTTRTCQHTQEVLGGDLVAAVVHLYRLAIQILPMVLVVEHLFVAITNRADVPKHSAPV